MIHRKTNSKIMPDTRLHDLKIKRKRAKRQDKILKITIIRHEERDSGYESAYENE